MEMNVIGRHCNISDALREQVEDRLSSIERLDDRAIRTEVVFTHDQSKGDPTDDMKVEITLRTRGPVVRAEATAEEKLAAFEKALDRLKRQLSKANDRRKRHRGLRPGPLDAPAPVDVAASRAAKDDDAEHYGDTHLVAGMEVSGDGPLVVREKHFYGIPLTLTQALDEMELVGHDFFLYVDAQTKTPSVVYRRKGYNYGVIHLDVSA